ncbi:MAG: hypothetical protein LAP85_06880 [Acidobacteriia bacterium]|nr:hypothetical protein [Terriglobia bacterium]
MKRSSISCVVALAVICLFFFVPLLSSQIKQDAKTKQDRLDGIVQSIDKDTSTITIRQVGATNFVWQIVYDKSTQFTYRNKPATFSEVKEGRRIICLGKADKPNKLLATRVDVRDK